MKTPWTPERWSVAEDTDDGDFLVIDCQEVTIARCYSQPLDPPAWAEANAALIALAPEMAQALEAYALPALNYLSIKAMSASDRAEFKDRESKVRAILARLPVSQ